MQLFHMYGTEREREREKRVNWEGKEQEKERMEDRRHKQPVEKAHKE